MDTYMVVLRIVHILAGVFWVGAAFTTILFLQSTAREVGPAAGPFMAHLAGKKHLVDWVLRAAGLTILAGLLMYWRVSGGLDGDWLASAPGCLAHDRSAVRASRPSRSACRSSGPRSWRRSRSARRWPRAAARRVPSRARNSRPSSTDPTPLVRSSCHCSSWRWPGWQPPGTSSRAPSPRARRRSPRCGDGRARAGSSRRSRRPCGRRPRPSPARGTSSRSGRPSRRRPR